MDTTNTTENTTTLYVARTTNTGTDTLLAVGLAVLMGQVLEALGRERQGIRIRQGPYYQIHLPGLLTASDLANLTHLVLVQPLKTEKLVAKSLERGDTLQGFPYEEQVAQRKAYREALGTLPPELSRPEARLEKDPRLTALSALRPSPDLACYTAISGMRIAPSFNELALRWIAFTPQQQALHVGILLTLFGQPHNDVEGAVSSWKHLAREYELPGKALATSLSIVNPSQGKGANQPRAGDKLNIGQMEGFWLLELLKFAGFMVAAAPFTVLGEKDRKIYVLQPEDVSLDTLAETMRDFRDVCWASTAVKLDIMAALRFAQVYVEYRRRVLARGEEVAGVTRVASGLLPDAIQGFAVTYYKDMGQAHSVMNIASLDLPLWLPPLTTSAQAEKARALLAEHVRIIRQIRNSRGEEGANEYTLLRHYRDFLSGRNFNALWAFTEAFSSYLISQRGKRPYFPQFDQQELEELIVMVSNTARGAPAHLTDMFANQGFQHVVKAIRHMTVSAQYRQSQGSRTYDVHYQLGNALMRAARAGRDPFIAELNQAVFRYNDETARVAARQSKTITIKHSRKMSKEDSQAAMLRRPLDDSDLAEVYALVDTYGPLLVGSTLVALGYAREHRVREEEGKGGGEEELAEAPQDAELEASDIE